MAVVYCLPRKLTPKAFSTEKRGEKFPIFLLSFFFFLIFLSREQDNAYRRCRRRDVAAAISLCRRGYDAVANESAADAVCSYVRSRHVTGGPFAGTVYYTVFLEQQPKCGHEYTNANSKLLVLKIVVIKRFFFFFLQDNKCFFSI